MLNPHWRECPAETPAPTSGAAIALVVGGVVALAVTLMAVLGSLMAR